MIAVRFDGLPADVTMLNASGTDGGVPVVNMSSAIPAWGLLSGETSDPVLVEFTAPTTSPLESVPALFDAGSPVAPTIDSIAPITAQPGDVVEVQLTGTGEEGFYYTWSPVAGLPNMELDAAGKLTIAPAPGQEGDYQFEVAATDGVRSTTQVVELNVVADPVTTTRISGYVLDTFSNPLPGIPVELAGVTVNTAADGSFELTMPSTIPAGAALKVHGDAYVGTEVFPFVAEKLPLLFGHEPYENVNNVVVRPIYLPALDVANGQTIDPAVDVTVTTSTIPGASVFVAAGSLEDQSGDLFAGTLSITEVPNDFTPAALPPDLFPDLVVTIQPGEMVFTTPAPLNLPNLAGYPAGTEMNLWSINPITGLFDNVGLGIVSADGSVVETVSGGVRNSSWHFFTPPPPQSIDSSESPRNEEKECEPCTETDQPGDQQSETSGQTDNLSETVQQEATTAHFGSSEQLSPAAGWSGTTNDSGRQTADSDFLETLRSTDGQRSPASAATSNGASGSVARSSNRYSGGSGWGTGGQLVMGSQLGALAAPSVTVGINDQATHSPQAQTGTMSADTMVSLHSGAVHKTHSLVSYQSQGAWRGLALHYDSERADARPILTTGMEDVRFFAPMVGTQLTIRSGNTEMVVPGYGSSGKGFRAGEHFFEVGPNRTVEMSLQADMRHLPTGVYEYEFSNRTILLEQNLIAGTASITTDQLIHVNSRDSVFGAGWGLSGWKQLIENADGSVLLVDGDGVERLFRPPAVEGDAYISPGQDFTTLIKLPDGTFQRTYPDQTVERYSISHKLASVTDRNGNQTQFQYNGDDQLATIVDPVGLSTVFRYVNGRVSEIEDPTGRITTLTYEGNNLTGIEDPDQTTRQFSYDSMNRLTGEVDKRGNSETIDVGFSGRVESITRSDGQTVEYSPAQTANLQRADVTANPYSGVTASSFQREVSAQKTDAKGNVTEIQLDQAGQRINAGDGIGGRPEISRNDDNLISQIVDGRGNVTLLRYDSNGNVVFYSDEVSRQLATEIPVLGGLDALAVADFNGDGNMDAAVSKPDFDEVEVFFGAGDGTFGDSAWYLFDLYEPANIQTADFNQDGSMDLVVSSEADSAVTILMNDGSGDFLEDIRIDVPFPTSMTTGDLDGDGDIDLVAGSNGQFHAIVNNGGNNFSVTTTDLDAIQGDGQVVASDFDGDGWLDVGAAGPNTSLGENYLEFFSGNGDGSFVANGSYELGGGTDENVDWQVTSARVADADQDGNLDILLTTPHNSQSITNNVSLLSGNGDGTFLPVNRIAGANAAQATAVGYLNDDAILDLVTVGQDGVVSVQLGIENQGFDPQSLDLTADVGANDVEVADLDGDGVDEIIVANQTAETLTIHSLNSNAKIFEYDPVFNQLLRTVDELGRETRYQIDPSNGNRLKMIEVIGEFGGTDDLETSYTYTASGLLETIIDPLGRVTRHSYNAQGLLELVTFAEGTVDEASIGYEYDLAGNRTAYIDELGNRTEYQYDLHNRVTTITRPDPDGAGPLNSPVTINEYDEAGNLERVTDAEGKPTEFVYDAMNRLIETIDATQQSTIHEYDAAGNLSATVDRLGRRTEFQYDARNRLVATLNAAGGLTSYEYDADNNRIAMIDENGTRTEYRYDARNRLTAVVDAIGGVETQEYDASDNLIAMVDELGRRTVMVYDDVNRLIQIDSPDPDRAGPQDSAVTQFSYDRAGNQVEVIDPLGNSTVLVYDQRNRLVGQIDADPDGAGPLTRPQWEYQYDAASRRIEIVDPLGRITMREFDNLDRLVSETLPDPDGAGPAGGPTTNYRYDRVDNLVAVIDPLGNTTTYQLDDLYRTIATVQPDPDGAGPLTSPTMTTEFDAEGQIIRMLDPLGRETNLEYDSLGRIVVKTLPDPDGAGPLTSPVFEYQYDAVGNLIAVIDALGNQTDFELDDLYRTTKTIGPDPDGGGGQSRPVTRYRYDAADQQVAQTDAIGRTTRFEYDDLGRLIAEYLPDPDGVGLDNQVVNRFEYDLAGNLLRQVDSLGNGVDYEYDQLYRVISVTGEDPDGDGPELRPVTVYQYDVASQLTSSTDPLGRKTTRVYDPLGRVVQIVQPDPDGDGPQSSPVMSYEYDLVGNMIAMTDALDNTTSYQHDSLYRQTAVIEADPDGIGPDAQPVTMFDYDAAGQLVAMTDPLGRVTVREYDLLGRLISETEPDPDGNGLSTAPVTTFRYDAMDNLVSQTDALGNTSDFVYDNLYRLIQTVQPDPDAAGPQSRPTNEFVYDLEGQLIATVDPLGRTSEFVYDSLGRIISTLLPDPDGAGPLEAPQVTFTFDLVGNLLSETDALGNVTNYEFDALYRQVRIIQADPDGAGPLQRPVTVMAYDLANQLLSTTDPLNRTTQREYDGLGRMVLMVAPDPDGTGPLDSPESRYIYDSMGNLLAHIDPEGSLTSNSYDNLFRLIETRQSDLDDLGPLGQPVTGYEYDLVGNLLAVTDTSGDRTEFAYDALDRVFEESIELAGVPAIRSFQYDLEDNLIRKTDRNGRVIEYQRDNLYRTVAERWLDPSMQLVNTIEFEFDKADQLLRAEDLGQGSNNQYQYDQLGRVVEELVSHNGHQVTFQDSFDVQSRRVERQATVGVVADYRQTYEYDGLHRLVQQSRSAQVGGAAVAESRFDFQWDVAGQLLSLLRFDDLTAAPNDFGLSTTYQFDDLGRPTSIVHQNQSDPLAAYDYQYDTDSKLIQVNSLIDGISQFGYDTSDQLVAATHDGQPDQIQAYDEDGNRVGDAIGDYNRLLNDGVYSYEYDAEGNLIQQIELSTGVVREFSWDHRNRLIRVVDRDSLGGVVTQQVDHQYDAFNRWIGSQADLDGAGGGGIEETSYFYDGNQIVLALDEAGNVAHRYSWGPMSDMLLADEQVGESIRWAAGDHQGTVRDLASADGQLLNHRVFDAVGNLFSESDPAVASLFGYTGRPFDVATGLQNNLHRWYSAEVGRWLSEDPIGFAAGDANLYRYVGNDFVNRVDPEGLDDGLFGKAYSIMFPNRLIGKLAVEEARASLKVGATVGTTVAKGFNLVSEYAYVFGNEFYSSTGLYGAEAANRTKENFIMNSPTLNPSYEIQQMIKEQGVEQTRAFLERELEFAELSAHIYNAERGDVIGDYDVAYRWDDLETGFGAALYRKANSCRFVLVFEGTESDLLTLASLYDNANNVRQSQGRISTQYEQAINLAWDVKAHLAKIPGQELIIAGHSLGGGLGTAVGIVTGTETHVIDPAGVHPDTVRRHGADFERERQFVTALRVHSEFLTTAQDIVQGPYSMAPNSVTNLTTVPLYRTYGANPLAPGLYHSGSEMVKSLKIMLGHEDLD